VKASVLSYAQGSHQWEDP